MNKYQYEKLRKGIESLRDEWDSTRAEFAGAMKNQSGVEKAESFGWWDASCYIVQDLERLLEEYHEVH